MRRLMISAMQSGGGKTVMTCALLRALRNRGLRVQSFKCGPDYIDPLFHWQALGIPARSLDLFLQGEAGLQETLSSAEGDAALLEGAMGFYDGISGTAQNSAWDIADRTDTPAVLVLRPQGQSLTLAAQVRGMQTFRRESRIAGLLLTDCRPSLYAHLAPILRRETGLPVLGFLPPMQEAVFPSRHLGLLAPQELTDAESRLSGLARQAEQTVDLDALLALGREEAPLPKPQPAAPIRCRIAAAWDAAFCFYYIGSLDALRRAGAEIRFFSPMADEKLPEDCHGLYLGGGYPELHAETLSRNASMRESICAAVQSGMPTVAECGGFLYLQRELEDADGVPHPMAGVLDGRGFRTEQLQRFGYLTLCAPRDSLLFRAGETIPAHEFHHWDCTQNGGDLAARRPSGAEWRCGAVRENLYAAFPHLYLTRTTAERFVSAAAARKERGA